MIAVSAGIDDAARAPVRILKGMDPLASVVRIGDVRSNRPEVKLPVVPARGNPSSDLRLPPLALSEVFNPLREAPAREDEKSFR